MSTFATLSSTRPATMTPAGDNSAAQPPAQPNGRSRPGRGEPRMRRGAAVLASLVINFAVPLAADDELRHHGASSALALALSGAIPVACTLAVLTIRRRLDPLGVISIVSFALGVLISWVSDGNTWLWNCKTWPLTGLAWIACLISVAFGRPCTLPFAPAGPQRRRINRHRPPRRARHLDANHPDHRPGLHRPRHRHHHPGPDRARQRSSPCRTRSACPSSARASPSCSSTAAA